MALARIAAGLLITLFLVAAPADAAVRFGDDVDAGPHPSSQTGTGTNGLTTLPAGSPLPVAAPSSGVLTRMRLRHGPTGLQPGYVSFRILRVSPTDPDDHRVRMASPNGGRVEVPFPASKGAGILTYLPVDDNGRRAGIPVRQGEFLGFYHFVPSGQPPTFTYGPGAGAVFAMNQDLSDDNLDWPFPTITNAHPLMDALLEPDADRDGYGDETQDNCASVANDQTSNPCPPATVVQQVQVPGPATTVTTPGAGLVPSVQAIRLCTVPRLRGLTLAAATTRLARARCARGRRTGSRSRRARVRTQTIPAGTRVVAGTRVGVGMRVPLVRRRS